MNKALIVFIFSLIVNTSYGQSWGNVGAGLSDNIYDLVKFNNKIYAGGKIGVRCWNDTSWINLPTPYGIWNSCPLTLTVYNDTLYISGDNPSSNSSSHVYKYDGNNWIPVGGDFGDLNWSSTKQLLSFKGQLISAGHYTSINGKNIASIASWNGATWSSLGNGLNGGVWDIAEHNGQLFATGDFTSSGSDTTVKYLAKWDGIKWSTLNNNNSFEGAGPLISINNMLIIGNVWDTVAGIPMKGIAVWNGTTFTSRGNNLIHNVNKFWIFNNELYLCGAIYTLNPNQFANVVLKWNGFFWQQVGINFNQPILAINDFNNQLFCGGFFSYPTSHIARLIPSSGISDINVEPDFQIYPNPAKEQITFNTLEEGKITITNQLGEEVYSVFTNGYATQLNLINMQAGLYYLIFETGNQKKIKQINNPMKCKERTAD